MKYLKKFKQINESIDLDDLLSFKDLNIKPIDCYFCKEKIYLLDNGVRQIILNDEIVHSYKDDSIFDNCKVSDDIFEGYLIQISTKTLNEDISDILNSINILKYKTNIVRIFVYGNLFNIFISKDILLDIETHTEYIISKFESYIMEDQHEIESYIRDDNHIQIYVIGEDYHLDEGFESELCDLGYSVLCDVKDGDGDYTEVTITLEWLPHLSNVVTKI